MLQGKPTVSPTGSTRAGEGEGAGSSRRAFLGQVGIVGLLPSLPAAALAQTAVASSTANGDATRVDPATEPFSAAGSYMAINLLTEEIWGGAGYHGPARLCLRSMRGDPPVGGAPDGLLGRAIDLIPGEGGTRIEATPEALTISAPGGGRIAIRYIDRLRIRIEGTGLAMRLSAPELRTNNVLQQVDPDSHRWTAMAIDAMYVIRRSSGTMVVDAPWDGYRSTAIAMDISGPAWALEIIEVERRRTPPPPALPDYASFVAAMPPMPRRYANARARASYVNWSSFVAASGNFSRPAMQMSKNWMIGVWSWDHCFNAIALQSGMPDLAWDQLMLPFDLQTIDGELPDRYQERTIIWDFVKPPIHGWTLQRMMERGPVSDERLRDFYPRLALATKWWLSSANLSRAGLPVYHHGNDSGWDNSTLFQVDMPLEAPDLSAFLVIQMNVLASLARRFGDVAAASDWEARAKALLALLLRELWAGERFVARSAATGATYTRSDSLVAYMPLVLGDLLPVAMRRKIVAALSVEGRFLCNAGFATESLKSPEYTPDGYWRGPVWAPSTLLLVDALRRLGETALATKVAGRFCDTCATSGFAENFDAISRKPLRDRAYTWTSSVFLALAPYLTA